MRMASRIHKVDGRSKGSQVGYALKYMVPTIFFMAGAVAAMYYGGLGYAQIQTTYLQSPLIETTALEANSIDPFFSFYFYCDATAMGVPIPVTPKSPLMEGQAQVTYTPVAFSGTTVGAYGCSRLSSPVAVYLSFIPRFVVV